MSLVRPQWVLRTGLLDRKVKGRNQPGYDFTRLVMDALMNKGLVGTSDCCTYSLEGQYSTFIPETGDTITLLSGKVDNLINPAGTLSTLTIELPANPNDGQTVKMTFRRAITTLTIDGNGSTLVGTAPTSAAIGTQLEYKYYTGIGFLRILS